MICSWLVFKYGFKTRTNWGQTWPRCNIWMKSMGIPQSIPTWLPIKRCRCHHWPIYVNPFPTLGLLKVWVSPVVLKPCGFLYKDFSFSPIARPVSIAWKTNLDNQGFKHGPVVTFFSDWWVEEPSQTPNTLGKIGIIIPGWKTQTIWLFSKKKTRYLRF